ncbi:MAG: CotH kinase family protein [Salinivirgaceae bacterium]|nr:CotH kinase family protein [Salinivirgaceae bacterium]
MKTNVRSFALGLIIFLFLSAPKTTSSQIIINEYSCANLRVIQDNFGKTEDWIELYNTSDNSVDVAGFYLSDKTSKPKKWQIPHATGSTIAAHGYLVFWCSKRDTAFDGHFHTNFSLKQTKEKKESIVLSSPSGELINNFEIQIHHTEHSIGRTTDGSQTWAAFKNPTLGESNNNSTPCSYAPRAEFNNPAGFYNGNVTIVISGAQANQEIRYTLNGTEPTASSSLYTSSLVFTNTTVLKAKIFSSESNVLPGLMQYASYLIDISHTLPVISISGKDLKELADDIDPWVRPDGTFEYFEDKQLVTRADGEYNKHGQDSWTCDQRSLDFIARDEKADNHSLLGQLFHLSDRDEFQRIILRASGDDNYPCAHNSANEGSAHMRDGFIQNLTTKGDLHLDCRISERNVVYLNGEYWGVYEIRENADDHDYTDYYYDQGKYEIQYLLTWGNTWAGYGGDKALSDWQKCYDYIVDNDMTVQENYANVKSMFNYKSFVDYILVNSFTVCTDWLNYNVGWWRGLNPEGNHKKWGYSLWDNDATFAFYINYTGLPDTSANALPCNPEALNNPNSDPEGHIVILNKLKENPEFYQYYVSRQADLLNTTFSSEYMLNYFDEYKAIIEPEMAQHAQRWYGTYDEWDQNTERLRNFIERRATALESGISDCYNLSGPYDLTITSNYPENTEVKVNSIEIKDFPWTGKYYEGIDTKLKSYVDNEETHKFDKWQSNYHEFSPNNTDREVLISLTAIDTVKALFQQLSGVEDISLSKTKVDVYPTVVTNSFSVDYRIEKPSTVTIDLYDVSGKKITQLAPTINHSSVGDYSVKFDFSNVNLAGGTYVVNFSTETFNKTTKIVYLK